MSQPQVSTREALDALVERLVAGVEFDRPEGGTYPAPVIGHYPDRALLAGG